ncbi:MAG: CAAX prenyl protease-related protein [Bryobacteraceae bacterium]|nr:CAAX prenyl protease-related protein [Bryobacteraceae bacterium]
MQSVTARKDIQDKPESSLPYVLPFVVFFALLSLAPYLEGLVGRWEFPLRAVILTVTLWLTSRSVIDLRVSHPISTTAVGIGVFLLWIGPDYLIPGYRNHWLFQNDYLGHLKSGIDPKYQLDSLVLAVRSFRAIILVPIIEELFWRAWLMRWLVDQHFWKVPLGAFTWTSMLVSAALFGSEHGSFWEVGIVAGLIYNFWMVRTRRLGDCILAHAVTNGCLSLYVVVAQRWEYWP